MSLLQFRWNAVSFELFPITYCLLLKYHFFFCFIYLLSAVAAWCTSFLPLRLYFNGCCDCGWSPLWFFFPCIQVGDISLADYVGVVAAKHATYVPHTAGRYSVKRFRKAQCPIVERLTNSLMMHGRNNGKKLMAVRIVKHAMEIIHLLTDLNPIQVIVDAVVNRYGDNVVEFFSPVVDNCLLMQNTNGEY